MKKATLKNLASGIISIFGTLQSPAQTTPAFKPLQLMNGADSFSGRYVTITKIATPWIASRKLFFLALPPGV